MLLGFGVSLWDGRAHFRELRFQWGTVQIFFCTQRNTTAPQRQTLNVSIDTIVRVGQGAGGTGHGDSCLYWTLLTRLYFVRAVAELQPKDCWIMMMVMVHGNEGWQKAKIIKMIKIIMMMMMMMMNTKRAKPNTTSTKRAKSRALHANPRYDVPGGKKILTRPPCKILWDPPVVHLERLACFLNNRDRRSCHIVFQHRTDTPPLMKKSPCKRRDLPSKRC